MKINTRSMEAQMDTNKIYFSGQQFWRQICGHRTCATSSAGNLIKYEVSEDW